MNIPAGGPLCLPGLPYIYRHKDDTKKEQRLTRQALHQLAEPQLSPWGALLRLEMNHMSKVVSGIYQ